MLLIAMQPHVNAIAASIDLTFLFRCVACSQRDWYSDRRHLDIKGERLDSSICVVE